MKLTLIRTDWPALLMALYIWLLVPFGRPLERFVTSIIPRPSATTLTAICALAAICAAAAALYSPRARRILLAAGLALAAAVYLLRPLLIEATHLLHYGALVVLLSTALERRAVPARHLLSFALATVVSLIDEGLQGLHPARYFDLRDLLLNAIGAGIGIVAHRAGRHGAISR